jgi:SagB-type dehydrogenase family enzyme
VINKRWFFLVLMLLLMLNFSACGTADGGKSPTEDSTRIILPEPRYDSDVSVEEAILQRRSIRDYADKPLTLPEVAQLLWAAQGITDPSGYRAAPSAGATYPLEIYAVIGNVEGVTQGIYQYEPEKHQLLKVVDGDKRQALAVAAVDQDFVAQAPLNIVITAIYERTTDRYGQRGIRYVDMEAGHAAQNVYLQAVALNLGTVVIGAFHDDQVAEILELPDDEIPLYIMPVGRIKE